MAIGKKTAAIGAAGIIALGGAGLYAGSLTVSATGSIAAGGTTIQASCATGTINVTPGAATWDATDSRYEYTTVTLTALTNDGLQGCNAKTASVTVYNTSNGSSVTSGTQLLASPANDDSATVTLGAGVNAGLSGGGFAVLIQ